MQIELKSIKVKDLIDGYVDNEEEGVKGYHGLLNIRPPYQREFVYEPPQEREVIRTIMKNFPLNTMYWVENEDGTYELLDGQQRTLSICHFGSYRLDLDREKDRNLLDGDKISLEGLLNKDLFYNYELSVYICKNGTDVEKLGWFTTINTANVKLTDQELRNISYTGTWLNDAKRIFSKKDSFNEVGKKFLKGKANRQEYLEIALDWVSDGKISEYMSEHQHDENANELHQHFNKVIRWVKNTFGSDNYREEMKGLDWGRLYKEYSNNSYDTDKLEERISALMADEEVTNKKGVYEYILSNESEELAQTMSKRTFSEKDKRTKYEQQQHHCANCKKYFSIQELQAHHIIAWNRGGKTTLDNLELLCNGCHKGKHGY